MKDFQMPFKTAFEFVSIDKRRTVSKPRKSGITMVSDEARFITGTEIIVDGGMSARCD